MGEGWIDPEGDRVVFYVHTEKVDEGKVRRMNPRPLTDIVSYDMMLGTGEAIRGSRGWGGHGGPDFLCIIQFSLNYVIKLPKICLIN